MADINGMSRNTRVGVPIGSLENIGDALRVHFGKKQEGTTKIHVGPDPLVIKGGGLKKLGPGYHEMIYTPHNFNNSHELVPILYGEYFDADHYVQQMTEPVINTIKIPGAKAIKIKMSYGTANYGEKAWNYLWIGAGLHEEASAVQGEYYPEFMPSFEYWNSLEEHITVCAGCGAPVVNGTVILPPSTTHFCEDESGNFPVKHSGPLLPYIEREIEGDSLTCAWMVDFTGNSYTVPDEVNYCGFYMEVIPYDTNGNEITAYQYIANEIPYSYQVGRMDEQIALLNNYPNAEEVKF